MKRPRRRGRSTGTIPTRAQGINHVWSWEFISDRTGNGSKRRILSVIDEYSRECLALYVARKPADDDPSNANVEAAGAGPVGAGRWHVAWWFRRSNVQGSGTSLA